MVPYSELSLIDPMSAPAGAWLLRPTHYDEGPAFLCEVRGRPMVIQIGGAPESAFHVDPAPNRGYWLRLQDLTVEVDPLKVISPQREDIPIGSICIIGEEGCICVRLGHATAYISLKSGRPVEENYGRFVCFPDWRLIRRDEGNERLEFFSSVFVQPS